MLSNPQLLTTVRKLLSVCGNFADFIQRSTDGTPAGESGDLESFNNDVSKFDLQFSAVLSSLLARIAQLGRENYNERILNILNRLDFNGFYTKAIEQFSSGPGKDADFDCAT